MLPIIMGITAAVESAIGVGEAAAIGAGFGAIGAGLLMKKRNTNAQNGLDDDDLADLVELIAMMRRNRAGKKPGNGRTSTLSTR